MKNTISDLMDAGKSVLRGIAYPSASDSPLPADNGTIGLLAFLAAIFYNITYGGIRGSSYDLLSVSAASVILVFMFLVGIWIIGKSIQRILSIQVKWLTNYVEYSLVLWIFTLVSFYCVNEFINDQYFTEGMNSDYKAARFSLIVVLLTALVLKIIQLFIRFIAPEVFSERVVRRPVETLSIVLQVPLVATLEYIFIFKVGS